jgi:ATP-dependent DNA helicase RecQ
MEKKMPIKSAALAVLRRFYGYNEFRPKQLEIIETVASGRDCVVLMPTGGGKSLCFQIPALIQPGVAVVVSPLIALMKDQVQTLIGNGIPAASLNSNQSDGQNAEVMDLVRRGQLKLLYVSPERLLVEMERWPENMQISLFAIDEAHCISQWGHDFRPEYTKLTRIKEKFPHVPIVALTATADKLTREDIAVQLSLKDPALFVSSFDRPNISLTVMQNPGLDRKLRLIGQLIERYPDDSGIVYCLSRRNAEDMANELIVRGYNVAVYHAGLSAAERNKAQDDFINGRVQVVCATIAFGMGIDKSNIRFVVHNNLPKNIEGYYQEIGRAGRDGLPAEALMFYSFADIVTLQNFINEGERQSINIEKLTRMREYAESSICRRRVLLSYFSETATKDCGNCDVCLSPPLRFDGTIIAQKALSAIVRTNQNVGINMLIDILRGSSRSELVARGYHLIKTYGVGRDLSHAEWNAYLGQMLQLGHIEIAYNESNHLRVTPYGQQVLRGEVKVTLAKFHFERPEMVVQSRKKASKTATGRPFNPALLKELKRLRLDLARIEGVPAYIIFSDKTLQEMAAAQPTDKAQFAMVHGIGEAKTERYWQHFTRIIRQFPKTSR